MRDYLFLLVLWFAGLLFCLICDVWYLVCILVSGFSVCFVDLVFVDLVWFWRVVLV